MCQFWRRLVQYDYRLIIGKILKKLNVKLKSKTFVYRNKENIQDSYFTTANYTKKLLKNQNSENRLS